MDRKPDLTVSGLTKVIDYMTEHDDLHARVSAMNILIVIRDRMQAQGKASLDELFSHRVPTDSIEKAQMKRRRINADNGV